MKANLLVAAALVTIASGLASCAGPRVIPPSPTRTPATRPPPPGRAPTPPTGQPAPAPAAPPSSSWNDAPATPGDWRWSVESGQSTARFAGNRLTLRCDPAARAIRVERSEPRASLSGQSAMTIRTQTVSRAISAAAQGGTVTTSLSARDPLLDAMAFTRGRFAVEVNGMPTLYIPSWTEVSRVIEDCR